VLARPCGRWTNATPHASRCTRRPGHTRQHVGRNSELEQQTHEVQPGLTCDDAALVDGPSVGAGDRQVDPRELFPVAGAPDHVRHVQRATLVDHGKAVGDAGRPADPLDTGLYEMLRLHPDERRSLGHDLRTDLAADRCAHRQHVVTEEADDREDPPRHHRAVTEGELRGRLARQIRLVRARHLLGDLGPRVADPDDQHRTLAALVGAEVLARVQLRDVPVQLGREARDLPDLVRARGDDDVVGLEAARARRHDVAVAVLRQRVDPDGRAHRQVELGRVGLEVVGLLVLRRERVLRRRERKTPSSGTP
jgi:hypothetical protein